MIDELVEAMARAICAAQGLDWKDQFSIYSSNGDPLAHEAYMHDADAALSAFRAWLAYEGLVVVPKLPSENQFRAGSAFRYAVELSGYKDTAGIYEAMIAAAPDALAKDAPPTRAQGESS